MQHKINGILFDLGDTLLDFGKVDVLGMFEAGARLAYEYLQSLGQPLPSFAKYHRRQLWAIRWNFFKSRFTRREFNSLEVLGKLGIHMGHRLTPDQTQELAWQWYMPLSRQAKVEEGTRALLEGFRDAGLKLGLVSNTFLPGTVLDRHLAAENLLDLLPVRVYSCDVLFRKPNPNIFAAALSRTGLSAASTLFVGDSPTADIEGANRAGLISVLKDPTDRHRTHSAHPRHRIRRLAELRDIVREYNDWNSRS
jgi:putative hydrolase of the HAD superfamily